MMYLQYLCKYKAIMERIADYTVRVANETAKQLGGRKFEKTTGAKFMFAFESPENGNPVLVVGLPANQSDANVMMVEYKPFPDVYRVLFSHINDDGSGHDVLERDEVYCDMLQDVFSNTTGISTEGCRVSFGSDSYPDTDKTPDTGAANDIYV